MFRYGVDYDEIRYDVSMYNSERKLVITSGSPERFKRIGNRDINLDFLNSTAVVSGPKKTEVLKEGRINLCKLRRNDRITLMSNDWLFLKSNDINMDIVDVSAIACISDVNNARNLLTYDCVLDGINSSLRTGGKDVTEKDVHYITNGIIRATVNEITRSLTFDEIHHSTKHIKEIILSALNENILIAHFGLKILDINLTVDPSRTPTGLTTEQIHDLDTRLNNIRMTSQIVTGD